MQISSLRLFNSVPNEHPLTNGSNKGGNFSIDVSNHKVNFTSYIEPPSTKKIDQLIRILAAIETRIEVLLAEGALVTDQALAIALNRQSMLLKVWEFCIKHIMN